MAYQVLARKWRPKKFEDVIGQSTIVRTLRGSIQKDRIGHAYVLTGTRGVGKTTLARIFAKSLRCQNLDEQANPCGACADCLAIDQGSSMDVNEIDGASNNSVDDIRQLVENVAFLPTSGRYKIYIIDEVHMLSVSAFNALLKTLEEPPAHVIFIFATTEPHKLLDTVLSRCQRFDLRPITKEDIHTHLKSIVNAEGFQLEDPNMLEKVADCANGSVRDGLSLMDQVLSFCEDQTITDQTLLWSLGLANQKTIAEMTHQMWLGNQQAVSKTFHELLKQGVDLKQIVKSLLEHLYHIIQNLDHAEWMQNSSGLSPEVIEQIDAAELFWIYETVSKDVNWAITSVMPASTVEIILSKVTLRHQLFGKGSKKKRIVPLIERELPTPNTESNPVGPPDLEAPSYLEEVAQPIFEEPMPEPVHPQEEEPPREFLEETPPIPEEAAAPVVESQMQFSFSEYMNFLRKKAPVLLSNLEQGNLLRDPKESGEVITIHYGFAAGTTLFYEFCQEESVRQKFSKLATEFLGRPVELNFEFRQISEEEIAQIEFRSISAIKKQNDMDREAILIEEIKRHPLIQKAEQLFDSKVDKVILHKRQKEK